MKTDAVVGVGGGKRLSIERLDETRYRIGEEEKSVSIEVIEAGVYSLVVDGASYEVCVRDEKKGFLVEIGAHAIPVRLEDPFKGRGEVVSASSEEGEVVLSSPMPGRVVGIKVNEGDEVKEGQGVVLIEAMKMENELHSPKSGKIKKIYVKVGEAVEGGQDLVVIE